MDEAALVAEGVTVERGATRVLSSVDLSARHGEVLAILGPNGAGKSTLLRAIAGLVPFAGTVRIDGEDASRLSVRERAQRLALVPQQTALRSALPVRDVVAQGRYAHGVAFAGMSAADRAAVERALETTDVARFQDRPFTALSFGEQRRVLVARGLATGARILCLDEPTASLDVHHALQLYALLRRLADEGHAVVVVLHQLDDALRHADRALLLSGGVSMRNDDARKVIAAESVREVYRVEMRHGDAIGFHLCGGLG